MGRWEALRMMSMGCMRDMVSERFRFFGGLSGVGGLGVFCGGLGSIPFKIVFDLTCFASYTDKPEEAMESDSHIAPGRNPVQHKESPANK